MSKTTKMVEIVYISTDKDAEWIKNLDSHLVPLMRQQIIQTWHDGLVEAGKDRFEQLESRINNAHIFIPLISPDFISSPHCYDEMLKRAVAKYKLGQCIILPIITRACSYDSTIIAHLKPLSGDNKPLNKARNRDESLARIAQEIEKIVKEQYANLFQPTTIEFKFSENWKSRLLYALNDSLIAGSHKISQLGDVFGDPVELAKYYVEPSCQQFNPADDDDEETRYIIREPIFSRIQNFLGGKEGRGNQLFILADAGMGKTSLLVMLKLAHLCSFWPAGLDCTLLKLGPDTLSQLSQIENRRFKILLLDALDEDPTAWGRIIKRLADILEVTQNFRRVVITCRTQFFSAGEDPFNRRGRVQVAGFLCPAIYLSLFDEEQVQDYCQKRFPNNPSANEKIQSILTKMKSLRCRPMLLAHVEDLLQSEETEWNDYTVYNALVMVWLLREQRKLHSLHKSNSPSITDLSLACYIFAFSLQKRGQRRLSVDEFEQLVSQHSAIRHLSIMDIGGRSLLNKNSTGEFRFSHYSIQEFLLVQSAINGVMRNVFSELRITDQIRVFLHSWTSYCNSEKRITKDTLHAFDFSQMNMMGWNMSYTNLNRAKLVSANLETALLRKTILTGAHLEDAVLARADVSQAIMTSAFLTRSDLTGAIGHASIFDEAHLEDAKLDTGDFRNSIFNGSHCKNAKMTYANFSDSSFQWADLSGTNFESSNLQNCNFMGAILENTNLTSAKLKGTSFSLKQPIDDSDPMTILSGTNMSEVDWPDAQLDGAFLHAAKLPGANLSNASLIGAILTQANLKRANLADAKMRCTNLENAILKHANLQRTDLAEARLVGADLQECDLRGANLDGAVIYGAQFSFSIYDFSTLWPSNFDAEAAHVLDMDEIKSFGTLLLSLKPRTQWQFISHWKKLSKKGREEMLTIAEQEGVAASIEFVERADQRLRGKRSGI